MKRIDELTGLRCIAVCMVLIDHATRIMPAWMARLVYGDIGDTGVQIFFVLSGFLITSLLMGEFDRTGRINFWDFYRRRLLRISPAFYFFLAVMGGLTVAGLIKANWQEFLVAGTYTWNYGHFLHIDGTFRYAADGQWYLGHTWSLALEEQFYWAWPALFIFIARRQCKRLLGCIILIVPLIRMASYVLEPYVRDQLHVMFHTGIDTILVGCFLAMHRAAIERRLHRFSTSPRFLSTLIGVVFLVIPVIEAKLGGYWLATYGATIEASLIALLILGIMTQPNHRFCQLLRCRPCMFMGVISYSLYLWQQLFCATDSPVYMPYPLSIPTLRVPIAILGSIGAACLSYYVIEKPFLKLKHRKHVAPPKALRPSSDMG